MGKTKVTLDKDKLFVIMERVINAPRERVYQAHTDPKQIAQWWGPRGYTTVVDKMEFSVGGQWRFIHKDEKGESYGFKGEYTEIVPNEKISWTFEFEPIAGHILNETLMFTDEPDGNTKLTATSHYPSAEDLNGMLNSGMEKGANESWDRLEELVQ